jgi:hypothetical protein
LLIGEPRQPGNARSIFGPIRYRSKRLECELRTLKGSQCDDLAVIIMRAMAIFTHRDMLDEIPAVLKLLRAWDASVAVGSQGRE